MSLPGTQPASAHRSASLALQAIFFGCSARRVPCADGEELPAALAIVSLGREFCPAPGQPNTPPYGAGRRVFNELGRYLLRLMGRHRSCT